MMACEALPRKSEKSSVSPQSCLAMRKSSGRNHALLFREGRKASSNESGEPTLIALGKAIPGAIFCPLNKI